MSTTIKVVNKGLDLIAAALAASAYKYLGWGTGTTAAAATDTALQTAQAPARATGTQSQVTTTATNDTYQVVGTLTAGGTLAITEAGLFDAAGTGSPPTGGNMLLHMVHDAVNLVSGDSIQYTIKIPFASA